MSKELAVVEAPRDLSLMSGPDPEQAIVYARKAAKALQSVIEPGSGFVTIQGKKHITIEGWQVLAAATNHSIEVEWSRPMDKPEGAWEARAVVRDVKGQTVAAGEAMASPDEHAPWTRNAYSIRSMAQTRAMSRAAASRLRYIPTLAGFSGTPAEEMPHDEVPRPAAPDHRKPVEVFKPMTPYDEIVTAGRADGMSTATIRKVLKEAGIGRPKDLEDPAVFEVAMEAVTGFVGTDDKGGMPVADLDKKMEKELDAEVVEGEVVDEPTKPSEVIAAKRGKK